MDKKGFTLIELLAVISILAVIALITTPIVLNVIDESEKSSIIVSANHYLSAAKSAIALSRLNDDIVESGVYVITSDGQICLEASKDDKCIGKSLKLEIGGEAPDKGYITISEEEITQLDLYYNGVLVRKIGIDEFIYPEYELGEEIEFDPGFGTEFTWNVVNETSDKVILLLNSNLPKSLTDSTSLEAYWNTKALYEDANSDGTVCDNDVCTDEGPLYIFDILSSYTDSELGNIDYIENFSYTNESKGSYKNIEIKNGEITITDDNNNKNVLSNKTKLRILTFEEVYRILLMSDPNITYELSDVKFDDNFENIVDNYGYTLQTAASAGIQSWNDLREIHFSETNHLYDLTKVEELIINSHLLLFSDNKLLGDLNIKIPAWIYSNLDISYALLNTVNNNHIGIFEDTPSVIFEEISDATNPVVGIRPVIEVSKDKLK